jgi:hypothetical protein
MKRKTKQGREELESLKPKNRKGVLSYIASSQAKMH